MTESEARGKIRKACVRAGGVMEVAAQAGIHFTRLYSWFRCEKELGPEARTAVRDALEAMGVRTSDQLWGAALAPRGEDATAR